jgi:hypothetical protein
MKNFEVLISGFRRVISQKSEILTSITGNKAMKSDVKENASSGNKIVPGCKKATSYWSLRTVWRRVLFQKISKSRNYP